MCVDMWVSMYVYVPEMNLIRDHSCFLEQGLSPDLQLTK